MQTVTLKDVNVIRGASLALCTIPTKEDIHVTVSPSSICIQLGTFEDPANSESFKNEIAIHLDRPLVAKLLELVEPEAGYRLEKNGTTYFNGPTDSTGAPIEPQKQ